MKVAIVSPAPHPKDPISHYALSLISYLKEYGLSMYLFSKKIPKEVPAGLHAFETFSMPRGPLYSLLDDLVREGPFDVVEIIFSFYYFPCVSRTLEVFRAIRKRAGPLLIRLSEAIHPRYDEYLNKFQSDLAKISDLLIVDHESQLVELMSEGIPEEKVRVVPMGSDYYPRSSRRRAFFLGVDWRNLAVISYYGPISKEVPLLDVIKGVEIARKERKDIFLLISGYSPRSLDLASFEALRAECERQRWIKVLYQDPELWKVHEIFSMSSAVLLPFLDPPGVLRVCPFLHLELYSGTPPIFSKSPRFLEVLNRLRSLSFRPGDVKGIADAILEGIEKKKPMRFLRRLSKDTSWERVARAHLRIYEELSGESQV